MENEPDHVKSIKQDATKWILVPVKIILECVCIWPENQNIFKRLLVIFMFLNYSGAIGGALIYFFENLDDLVKCTTAFSNVSSVLQIYVKIITLFYYSSEFVEIITVIRFKFWPSFLADDVTIEDIYNRSRLLKVIISVFLSSSLFAVLAYSCFNLINGKRELPVISDYPFNWTESPTYEYLYLWQFLTLVEVLLTFVSYDILFFTFIEICISQIRIIASVLKNLHNDKEKYKEYFKVESNGQENDNAVMMQLIASCVEQHKILNFVYNRMAKTYSCVIFTQFISSIVGVCLACVTMTARPEQSAKMLAISTIMLPELLIYCWNGERLIGESLTIADGVYESGWHLSSNLALRKAIVMIIQKSQQSFELTGFGLITLNLQNFMKVLKFSFSFYTLLQTMVNK